MNEDDSSDDDYEDSDSNAEDYYQNDYPEDELSEDDLACECFEDLCSRCCIERLNLILILTSLCYLVQNLTR